MHNRRDAFILASSNASNWLNAQFSVWSRTLLTDEVTPQRVRDEVSTLLDASGHRAAAGEVAAEIAAMPAAGDVVPLLEALAAG